MASIPSSSYYPTSYQASQPVIPDIPRTQVSYRARQVQDVPPPYTFKPADRDFYVHDPRSGVTKPNLELLKDHLLHEGRVEDSQAIFILNEAYDLMSKEPNMLGISSPVTVCGDIHGQFYDLMKVFEVGGNFDDNNYLFLGDYVDRGCFSIECLLYLYALKLWCPDQIFLLRGNHECRHLTSYFTFERECTRKYSTEVYDACCRSWQALPIAALIDSRFFCVHGGISPDLPTLDDIRNLNRFVEPPQYGGLCDLLWADPWPHFGDESTPTHNFPEGLPPGALWQNNDVRGCSYHYTYLAVCQFLERNGLLSIIRGHEVQDPGYHMARKTPKKKFPSVITVFSAPNYVDVYKNRGAIIKYKNKSITIRQFNSSSHPYWLPNFMDAFTWSLPFVGEKITDMLLHILAICSEEELEEDESSDEDDTRTIADLALTPTEIAERRQQIKNKILAVGKMQRVFKLLREESESATELAAGATAWPGGFTAGASGTPNALGVQTAQERRFITTFDEARKLDLANERLPLEYDPLRGHPMLPAPSMRLPRLSIDNSMAAGGPASAGLSPIAMEDLVRQALREEGLEDGGVVERIAERIARGKSTGRPRALKRYETAP